MRNLEKDEIEIQSGLEYLIEHGQNMFGGGNGGDNNNDNNNGNNNGENP